VVQKREKRASTEAKEVEEGKVIMVLSGRHTTAPLFSHSPRLSFGPQRISKHIVKHKAAQGQSDTAPRLEVLRAYTYTSALYYAFAHTGTETPTDTKGGGGSLVVFSSFSYLLRVYYGTGIIRTWTKAYMAGGTETNWMDGWINGVDSSLWGVGSRDMGIGSSN